MVTDVASRSFYLSTAANHCHCWVLLSLFVSCWFVRLRIFYFTHSLFVFLSVRDCFVVQKGRKFFYYSLHYCFLFVFVNPKRFQFCLRRKCGSSFASFGLRLGFLRQAQDRCAACNWKSWAPLTYKYQLRINVLTPVCWFSRTRDWIDYTFTVLLIVNSPLNAFWLKLPFNCLNHDLQDLRMIMIFVLR